MNQTQFCLIKMKKNCFLIQINEVRKYFSSVTKNENYEKTLEILSSAKKTTDNFFENVIVNDDNENVSRKIDLNY